MRWSELRGHVEPRHRTIPGMSFKHQDKTKTPSGSLDPYREALAMHGARFETTLWRSKEAQHTRFAVLTQMIDLTDRVVLDAGCGLGDYCAFLSDDAGVSYARYIGIDGLGEMVRAADERRLPRAAFFERDFVVDEQAMTIGEPDVISFSGSLNTVPELDAQAIVQRAFEIARVGVAFNFLSDRASKAALAKDTGPASRFNTAAWVDWALSQTVRVQFRQDYLDGHDATIAMVKV